MEKKLIWNLNNMFETNTEFYKEIKEIENSLETHSPLQNLTLDSNNLLKLLNFKWSIKERTNKILIYGSLNYYKNVESSETKCMKEEAEQLMSKTDVSLSYIDKKILESDIKTVKNLIETNKKLNIYRKYIEDLFRKKDHNQNSETEQIIKIKTDLNNNWLKEYNEILHNINFGSITIEDKEIELIASNLGKYLSSRNRETRRATYISMNLAYKKHEEKLASILDSIYTNRVNISNLEKYSSVLEKSLFDENIEPQILVRLIEIVHKNISVIQKYLELKVHMLEIKDPHLYDYGVPLDNENKKKYTLDKAIKIIKKALEPLGEEYIKTLEYLIDNNYIDSVLDQKKHQFITFSWSIYSFLNYKESYADLKNLVHEIGHIINAYLSEENQPYLYSDSTVFVGETASLVNELLLNKYLLENTENKEEKLFYLSQNIENYFVQIYKQVMYTEYENKLYSHVENKRKLTPELLGREILKLQKQYYGNDIIYDSCSNIEWAKIGHLYRHSYYVYNYATGLIIASSTTKNILNNKKTYKDKYINFLSSGSNANSIDMLKEIDVDLKDTKVLNKAFEILKNNVEEFNNLISNNQK